MGGDLHKTVQILYILGYWKKREDEGSFDMCQGACEADSDTQISNKFVGSALRSNTYGGVMKQG